MTTTDVPVLIVGGGPVGLAMSICLSRLGVESWLVERHPTTTTHPKATVVNTRTMELFRLWGVDDAVRRGALPADRMRYIVWATTLAGYEIGRLDLGAERINREGADRVSPTAQQICPQDIVEPAMADVARVSDRARIDFGTELVSFDTVDDRVHAVIRGSDGSAHRVSARYLVAADGASSSVRRSLGIEMAGSTDLGHLVNIHVRADLRPWIDERPGPLYWIVNPEASGVFIALNGSDRWLFNTPQRAPHGPATDECVALVRRAVGVADLEVDVLSAIPWTAASLVAATFRRGPCFLVGDAAHHFPPTGGHGMNSGIQDAHNLAWKLAQVLRGAASERLLDTYETERRPVAQRYADESVKNARGQGSSQRSIPSEVEREGAEGQAIRDLIAATIPSQRGHFVSPGLQLGFRYRSAAIIDDPTEDPASPDHDVTTFRQIATPGHRAPHAWLDEGRGGQRRSTLDAFDGTFTLVVADRGSIEGLAGVPAGLEVLELGVDQPADGADPTASDGRRPSDVYGLRRGEAVLVRPDGFVAWRSASAGADGAVAQAIARVLASLPDDRTQPSDACR